MDRWKCLLRKCPPFCAVLNVSISFPQADDELKLLTVDEEAMMSVMAMGFTQPEARLGLRVCEGNVQLAVAHIMKRREVDVFFYPLHVEFFHRKHKHLSTVYIKRS